MIPVGIIILPVINQFETVYKKVLKGELYEIYDENSRLFYGFGVVHDELYVLFAG